MFDEEPVDLPESRASSLPERRNPVQPGLLTPVQSQSAHSHSRQAESCL